MAITTPLASNANKTTSYINNAFAKNSGNTLSNQLGVNAKAPAPATSGNTTIKPNMSVAPNMSPAFIGPMDTNSEATKVKNMQTQLNAKNAGQPGWIPLQVDGILGPKTKAAQSFKPTTTNSGTTGGSSYSSGSTTGGSYQSQPLQYQPSQYQAPAQQQQYQTPPQQYTSTQQENQSDISNTSFLQNLAKKQNEPSSEYKDALEKANAYNDALLKSKTNQIASLAENNMNPIPLYFKQGRERILQDAYLQQQNALSTAYGAAATQQGQANTQQGLQQSATTAGVSATMPQMQFGMLTNPQTGEIVGGQGSNAQQLMGSSLQKAQQMFANGSTFEDAIAQSGLAQFGNLGSSLLSSAIMSGGGGGYNPTAYNTQVGTNMENLSNTQRATFQLDTALKNIKTLEPKILGILEKSGLNPSDAALVNKPINEYISSLHNTAAANAFQLTLNELDGYTSAIISSGSNLTPTAASALTALQNPSTLSYNQMKYYLGVLDELGNNRQGINQGQINALGGSGVGYTGTQKNTTGALPIAPKNTNIGSNINNPTLQALAGGTLQYGPSALNAAATGASAAAGAKLVPLFLKLLKFL